MSQWYDGLSESFVFRIGISKKILTVWYFETGKSTSELRFVQEQPIFSSQCIGSKKLVEIAKSIDELMTSRSIVEHDLPDFDMLDAMIASAFKKPLNTQTHFRKSECRRAAAQKTRPFLSKKTNCVHDLRVFPCMRSL